MNKSKLENYREVARERIEVFQSMPTFVTQIVKIMNDPNADTAEIVESMKYDPGLTANILRMANSAYFGVPREVSSVNEAIVRLGVKRLFDLVIATGIVPQINRDLVGYDLRADQLLCHSVWVAVASEELCRTIGESTPDLIFTAGILHDIGKVIIADFVEDNQRDMYELIEAEKISFDDAESAIIGINHSEAGALILDKWNFPAELVDAVRWHHSPGKHPGSSEIVSIIHLADALGYSQGVGTGVDGMKYIISGEVSESLGVTDENIEYVASVTLDKMTELQELLCSFA